MAFGKSINTDVRPVFFLFVALALNLLSMGADCAEEAERINAKFFIGTWKCEVLHQAVSFRWEVESILDGRWLSGRTSSHGVLQSIDIWKVENDGQPSLRRVFLSDGSSVESQSQRGWKKLKLRSHGLLKEKKRVIETRETLRWVDEKTFEAKMERKVEKKWIPHSTEVCSRL